MTLENLEKKEKKSSLENLEKQEKKSSEGDIKYLNRVDVPIKKKKKFCYFCKVGISHVDYTNETFLRPFIDARGGVKSRKLTGLCSKHQRKVCTAIKRGRHLAILCFTMHMGQTTTKNYPPKD